MKRLIILISISTLFLGGRVEAQKFQTDSIFAITQNAIEHLMFRTQDTNYIKDYSNELALYLLSQIKLNRFGIWDRNPNNSLFYEPDNRRYLGFGMSYKYVNIELSFNIDPFDNNPDESIYFDFQASAFTKKSFIEATFQYYFTYQIQSFSPDIYVPQDSYLRPDIRTINLALQYFHVVNHGKFSLRAPFMMTQLQKKSAGSIIGGGAFNLFIMDSDSSIIPPELQLEFNPKSNLFDLNVFGVSANLGYMHTFVWGKKFFLTLSLMPGLTLNAGDFFVDTRELIHPHLSFSTKTMNAFGYNSRRFFIGTRIIGDLSSVTLDHKLNYIISRGRFKIFAGWRFKNKKKGSTPG